MLAEPRARLGGERLRGRLWIRHNDAASYLVGIPAREQRHLALLAVRERLAGILREKVPVDILSKPQQRAALRRLKHFVGRLCAQRGQRFGAKRLGKGDADLFGDGKRRRAESCGTGRKEGAAFANRAMEQPARERCRHHGADGNDPADSPKIVTLPGSPPNAAILSFTHWSAATWSIKA